MSIYVHSGVSHHAIRKRAKVRVRNRRLEAIYGVVRFVVFVAASTVLLWCGLSLTGFILIERAWQAAAEADVRAAAAEATVAELRSRLENMTSAAAVEKWASLNGFVPFYSKHAEAERVERTAGSPRMNDKINAGNNGMTDQKVKPKQAGADVLADNKLNTDKSSKKPGDNKQRASNLGKAEDV